MSISISAPSSRSIAVDTLESTQDTGLALPSEATTDPITDVAVLMAQSFRDDRKQALRAADAAEAARFREAEQQVQEMREKADSLRSEGWVRGATMIVSGASGALGAGLSIGKSEAASTRLMTLGSASGKGVEGIGMGLGGNHARAAQQHQAEADIHDARATTYKVSSEKYRDEADEAQRMGRKVMEFLDHMVESRDAAEGAASVIRG